MIRVKTVRKNSQVWRWVTSAIKRHDKWSGCYFWKPPSTASQRRQAEFDEGFEFILNGVHYDIEQWLVCSCNNFYYEFSCHVNGKKKNIRALKKLVKETT